MTHPYERERAIMRIDRAVSILREAITKDADDAGLTMVEQDQFVDACNLISGIVRDAANRYAGSEA